MDWYTASLISFKGTMPLLLENVFVLVRANNWIWVVGTNRYWCWKGFKFVNTGFLRFNGSIFANAISE